MVQQVSILSDEVEPVELSGFLTCASGLANKVGGTAHRESERPSR